MDTTAPLVVTVKEDGVTLTQITLDLSLGPRILLLLHGMNSNTATWNDLVMADFGANLTTACADIFAGTTTIPDVVPLMNDNAVRCYRLQFGEYDDPGVAGLSDNIAGVGVTNVTSENTPNYLTGAVTKCGDFETFDQLGREVDDAISAGRRGEWAAGQRGARTNLVCDESWEWHDWRV